MKNRGLYKNNKGYSFVLVLVGMSIVALLLSAIFYSVYHNYLMKVNNLKSEDSFYSTEQVLDEIKAGLQTDMSEAVTDAYGYVLERYSETEGQDATRDWYFQTKFVDTLRADLLDSLYATSGVYDIGKLANYIVGATGTPTVEKNLANGIAKATVTMQDGGVAVISINASNLANSLAINYSSGVTLKDLKVELTDSKGYYSVISTDLCLGIPSISFTQTSTAPDILSYGIIANEGIETEGTLGNAITGNVYAGPNGIEITGGTMVMQSDDYTISQGTIQVNSGAVLNFQGGSMWAQGVLLEGSSFTTSGNTYVKDDLTLNGANSTANLNGNYYGFSNPNRLSANTAKDENNVATDSSAIVVNGRGSTLNLSGLNSLMLAGNTYVKANASTNLEGSSKDPVLMGESIAVKSNQLMYLTPSQIIEVSGDTAFIAGNPMEYLDAGAVVTMRTDVRVAELGGKTLAELGIRSGDCQVYYTQNNSAYVYMKLDEEQAAAYSAAYFSSAAGAKVKEYLELYLSDIQLSSDAKLQTNGNILTQSKVYGNTINSNSNMAEVENEEVSYQDAFLALTKKLLPSYTALSSAEKASDVFNNLVYTGARQGEDTQTWTLSSFLDSKGTNGTFTFKTPTGELLGILSKKDYVVSSSDIDNDVRLLVVDGDVTVGANLVFEGVIICSGTVTLEAGAKVVADPAGAAAVFQCIYPATGDIIMDGDIQISPMYFFRDGEEYLLSSIATGSVHGSAGKLIDVADYITYNNWKKM